MELRKYILLGNPDDMNIENYGHNISFSGNLTY